MLNLHLNAKYHVYHFMPALNFNFRIIHETFIFFKLFLKRLSI